MAQAPALQRSDHCGFRRMSGGRKGQRENQRVISGLNVNRVPGYFNHLSCCRKGRHQNKTMLLAQEHRPVCFRAALIGHVHFMAGHGHHPGMFDRSLLAPHGQDRNQHRQQICCENQNFDKDARPVHGAVNISMMQQSHLTCWCLGTCPQARTMRQDCQSADDHPACRKACR